MPNSEAAWIEYERAHPIVVSDRLTKPHPMTEVARNRLGTPHPPVHENWGVVYCISADTIWTRVHHSNIDRALRIIDALAKACDKRGFQCADQHSYLHTAMIKIGSNAFALTLNERMSRRPYEPTAREAAERKRNPYSHLPKYSYHSSGQFQLGFDHCRTKWQDQPDSPLEAQLNAVMIDLRRIAADMDECRHQREEEARHIAALHAERDALRARVRAERKAVKSLRSQSIAWNEAQKLRAFVQARTKQCGDTEDQRTWAAWALEQADRLDPLAPSPPSILDTPSWQYRELRQLEVLNEDGSIQSI